MSLKPLKFYLPLPAPELSPNARGHWSVKAKQVKSARKEAMIEARRVLAETQRPAPLWAKAKYKAVFCLLAKHHTRDPDNSNASLKSYLDGLADAGIVINDRDLWPERPEFMRVDRMPRVEITVTPEDAMSPQLTFINPT